jgi:hypothetical protein
MFRSLYFKLLLPVALVAFYSRFSQFQRSYLNKLRVRFSGHCFGDPSEIVTYYHHFHQLVLEYLHASSHKLRILDLGSPKYLPITLSIDNHVDSVVLKSPNDSFSNVNYIVSDFLDFNTPLGHYDYFISPVTINLLGLGRYGEAINFNALPKAASQIYSLLKPGGYCLLALTIGDNYLSFNNGIYLSFDNTLSLFSDFKLINHKFLSTFNSRTSSYDVIFFCFQKP